MRQITRIGLDIAKRWFQVHAVDCDGHEILNRKLPRDKVLGFLGALPACEVALEACSSLHFWGREISRLGHRVRLISPNYVKPFVKRGKSDAHDSRAICEAASRPDMRFVQIKTEVQQAALMQHTSRRVERHLRVEKRHCANVGIPFGQLLQVLQAASTVIDDHGKHEKAPLLQRLVRGRRVLRCPDSNRGQR
jgi:transposase